MSNTQALLDKAVKLCSPSTSYQLAKKLGVSTSRMSHWRNGRATPDNEVAFKLAKILRMPISDIIGYIEEDRATTPEKKEFWRQQLPRVLPSIAIGTALLLGLGGNLIDGSRRDLGTSETATHTEVAFTPLYIMRIWKRFRRALRDTLKTRPRYRLPASAAA